jgi:hypothetical protein
MIEIKKETFDAINGQMDGGKLNPLTVLTETIKNENKLWFHTLVDFLEDDDLDEDFQMTEDEKIAYISGLTMAYQLIKMQIESDELESE